MNIKTEIEIATLKAKQLGDFVATHGDRAIDIRQKLEADSIPETDDRWVFEVDKAGMMEAAKIGFSKIFGLRIICKGLIE